MNLQININKLVIIIFVPLFTFSSIGACQEKETKMTLQEMLFKSFREYDWQKSYELVQQAIKEGADLNIQNDYGDTALIYAVDYRNKEIVQLLLDAKANPNVQDKGGNTALISLLHGDKEIVQLLLDAKANPDIQNKERSTALILAAILGNQEIVQLLLDANADIDIKNYRNKTALDEVSIKKRSSIFLLVIENPTAQILKNEPERRKTLIQKEAGKYISKVLAEMVSEYVVSCPKIEKNSL